MQLVDVVLKQNRPFRDQITAAATVAMVTDFDCWHPEHEHVSVDAVIRVLMTNADKARALVRRVIPTLGSLPIDPADSCYTALENAIITPPEARDPALVKKLAAVAGRVLKR